MKQGNRDLFIWGILVPGLLAAMIILGVTMFVNLN